ncbi:MULTISPECIES: SMP-30/gluconolactonase/LRE family protein [unclassified Arenibacter]|uniref:SMP-30/gluconolactonase/LRE family protein n=1 Tax=unclassified Arenibacter TaxID=2615047 RepID=UPI000E34D57C|nr:MULTISPECIES: SMP-30/gluconolactonase/LRE family protein [unclassified Arenibacter]MCM4165357.1 gluconolactonase [Arenibacter sp. A80]RFT54836.1 SMP-30/gluconolactonase/LRE family protein [Arenibacter sp. P308M17]
MKKITSIIIGSALLLWACKENNKKTISAETNSSPLSIEILDNEALQIIDPKSKIEILASGFAWTEGPLWIKEGNYLLFSDIPNNKVYKLDPKNNDTVTYLNPSGFSGTHFTGEEPGSNGLLLNKEGELVLLQHGNRQVAKMNASLSSPSSNFTNLVNSYKGKKLNSPNDATFDKNGNLYFTDPPYGLPKRMDDEGKELDFQGIYCLMATGELMLLDTISRPNGIGISPDGNVLYVANSDPEHAVWYQYQLSEPGKVTNKKLFYEVTDLIGKEGQQGLPDGLKINNNGILFATGPGGIWIFNSQGKALARILTGQATANCAFDTDQKKLYITADDYIMAVDLK